MSNEYETRLETLERLVQIVWDNDSAGHTQLEQRITALEHELAATDDYADELGGAVAALERGRLSAPSGKIPQHAWTTDTSASEIPSSLVTELVAQYMTHAEVEAKLARYWPRAPRASTVGVEAVRALVNAANALNARLEGMDGDDKRTTWVLIDAYEQARSALAAAKKEGQ